MIFYYLVFSENFYIPVVSWLSPALASRATLRSTKQRVTVASRQEAASKKRDRRSLPDTVQGFPEESYRHSQSGAVQQLKSRVKADADESFLFENRLQTALLSDASFLVN
jgi:hypothetical protein